MKKIIWLMCIVCMGLATACSDDGDDVNRRFSSVITPGFSFDNSQEIIAGQDAVTFTNTSTVEGTDVESYFWHFGFSGEGNWSEEANPAPVMYKSPGTYTVTLTVEGVDGNKVSTRQTIEIKAANAAPSANFSYSPEAVEIDDEVTFTDTSSDSDGEIVSRLWTFPDNTTSTEASPRYTFTTGGTFAVKLQVTDDRGASNDITKNIYVAGGEDVGEGTAEQPWLISTADRWNEIAQAINTSTGTYTAAGYYLVTTNVDFSGTKFTAWDTFTGHLDGNGNTLKGITATYTVPAGADGTEEAGAFGVIRINEGTVRNLKVEANFTSDGRCLGGIVGQNKGTLDGVYFVKGKLIGGENRVGGIAGVNKDGVIVNSASLGGTVEAAGECASGIAGAADGGFIINCYCWVESIASVAKGNTGGIVGYGSGDAYILKSYEANGTITAGGTYGGAFGYGKKINIQNIYGNAAITAGVIGGKKNTGSNTPADWPEPTSGALELGNMTSGSVTVPSNQQECGSFVEALNAGITIYNGETLATTKPDVTLRQWKASSTYPVLAD